MLTQAYAARIICNIVSFYLNYICSHRLEKPMNTGLTLVSVFIGETFKQGSGKLLLNTGSTFHFGLDKFMFTTVCVMMGKNEANYNPFGEIMKEIHRSPLWRLIF